jgi:hypothetical protein
VSYSTYGGADRISDWIPLEGGRRYYVEAAHLNNWGGSFFTMGVEIEQEVLNPNHPNNVKEVQRLSFETEDVREMHKLTIDNPDEGTFRIAFRGPAPDMIRETSGELKTNMSGSAIRDGMKVFWNKIGLNTIVVRKNLDAAGTETDVKEDIVKTVYEISLDRLVSAPSTSTIQIIKGSSKSTFTLEQNAQVSGPPMSGQW